MSQDRTPPFPRKQSRQTATSVEPKAAVRKTVPRLASLVNCYPPLQTNPPRVFSMLPGDTRVLYSVAQSTTSVQTLQQVYLAWMLGKKYYSRCFRQDLLSAAIEFMDEASNGILFEDLHTTYHAKLAFFRSPSYLSLNVHAFKDAPTEVLRSAMLFAYYEESLLIAQPGFTAVPLDPNRRVVHMLSGFELTENVLTLPVSANRDFIDTPPTLDLSVVKGKPIGAPISVSLFTTSDGVSLYWWCVVHYRRKTVDGFNLALTCLQDAVTPSGKALRQLKTF